MPTITSVLGSIVACIRYVLCRPKKVVYFAPICHMGGGVGFAITSVPQSYECLAQEQKVGGSNLVGGTFSICLFLTYLIFQSLQHGLFFMSSGRLGFLPSSLEKSISAPNATTHSVGKAPSHPYPLYQLPYLILIVDFDSCHLPFFGIVLNVQSKHPIFITLYPTHPV